MDLHGNVTKNRGTTELRYQATPENALDARIVDLFESRALPGLAQFSVIRSATGADEVVFDISRFEPLAERLGKADAATLAEVFSHLRTMLATCVDNRLLLKNVVFETDRVYYDSWSSSLRFIYLPFEGLSPDVPKLRAFYSALPALVRPADSATRELLDRYQEYFRDSPSFNPGNFQRFLGELAAAAPQQAGSREAEETPPMTGTTSLETPSTVVVPDSDSVPEPDPAADVGPALYPGPAPEAAPGAEAVLASAAEPDLQPAPAAVTDPAARGAHARIEPGTTVLDALPYLVGPESHSAAASRLPDPGTTVLDQESPFISPAAASPSAPDPAAAPARPRAFIVRRHPPERVELRGERFVVGKSKYSDYQVTRTTTVSRSHAVFTYAAGAWYVEDDRSKNGTFLDGRRLDPNVRTQVPNGARIRMSDEEFTFEVD